MRACTVDGDTLYVSEFDGEDVSAFGPIPTLVSGQFPLWTLGGPSLLDQPRRAVVAGNRVWIANRFDADIGADDFGLFGFETPVTTAQSPDVRLSTPFEEVHDLVGAGGYVWGASVQFDYAFVITDPATRATGENTPTFSYFDPRIQQAHAVFARVR